ncbi:MAG: ABC transporter transmembrane domain-containing protein [Rhodopseudomonas palustris]|nr:ABC transporter transmembrane domain-containing protein [Rhodopseudomonas palustris]
MTFIHMHELSLRFHLMRKTGGLTRVLERGRNGIETIVRMVLLQLVPTIIELALLMGVLLWQFDWRYVAVTVITVTFYMLLHLCRDRMADRHPAAHERDPTARPTPRRSTRLLNYETVKYFGAEQREAAALRPLDGALRAGQRR